MADKCDLFHTVNSLCGGGTSGGKQSHRKIFQFNQCLETVFPALKLTQNCYLGKYIVI